MAEADDEVDVVEVDVDARDVEEDELDSEGELL